MYDSDTRKYDSKCCSNHGGGKLVLVIKSMCVQPTWATNQLSQENSVQFRLSVLILSQAC